MPRGTKTLYKSSLFFGTPCNIKCKVQLRFKCEQGKIAESEFNKLEPCLKSAKNRFQTSADLNLETLN